MPPSISTFSNQAACKDMLVIFFPAYDDDLSDEGALSHPTKANYIEAKAVCAKCPARVDCLEYALETRQTYGVWGGTTKLERQRIRRQRRRSKP